MDYLDAVRSFRLRMDHQLIHVLGLSVFKRTEDVTAIFKVDIGGIWYATFTTEDIADTVIN